MKLVAKVGLVVVLGAAGGAFQRAEAVSALSYSGGPVISPEIIPIFWGSSFAVVEMSGMYTYLQGLVDYMSGRDLPSGTEPTVRQYGVWGAMLDPPIWDKTSFGGVVDKAAITARITALQNANPPLVPTYGSQRLFIVFTKGL